MGFGEGLSRVKFFGLKLVILIQAPILNVGGFSPFDRNNDIRILRPSTKAIELGRNGGVVGVGVINADNAQISRAAAFLGLNENLGIDGVSSFRGGYGLVCGFYLLKGFCRAIVPCVFGWDEFDGDLIRIGRYLSQD